jgi:thiamine-phosphate pyrophosphorylase
MKLYLVTDREVATGGLVEAVGAALRGGVDLVQLREKDLPTEQLCELAGALQRRTREHGAKLLINDRADVALAIGADGVHLPGDSFTVADARALLGPHKIIGVSTHSIEQARRAATAGADFVVLGPIFDTPSKRPFGAPLGLERLRRAVQTVEVPVIAIGGIGSTNAAGVAATGCAGVAVIRSVLAASNPETAAKDLRAALGATPGPGTGSPEPA